MRLPLHEWTAALLAWNTQVKQANKQNKHERKQAGGPGLYLEKSRLADVDDTGICDAVGN